MDAAPDTPAEEELDLFSMLVEPYEREHYPIDPPDPVDAILFRMDQQGVTRADLAPFIGSQSKVSEVLNRKRPLSLAMIRSLHRGLGIRNEFFAIFGASLPRQVYCRKTDAPTNTQALMAWQARVPRLLQEKTLPPAATTWLRADQIPSVRFLAHAA